MGGVCATQAYNCFLCVCFMGLHAEKAVYPPRWSAWLQSLAELASPVCEDCWRQCVHLGCGEKKGRSCPSSPVHIFPTGTFSTATHAFNNESNMSAALRTIWKLEGRHFVQTPEQVYEDDFSLYKSSSCCDVDIDSLVMHTHPFLY